MHDLIASLLMETNWLNFLWLKTHWKKNEDLFENVGYLEEREF
jgi:hypothetical protein